MKVREKFWKTVVTALTVILLLTAAPTNEAASSTNFTIISPDDAQALTGKTYEEWSVAWWQHTLEIPFENSPIFDPTGANCNFEQEGSVFFLAATSGGSATRNECVVPAGKILFFPLLGFANIREVTDRQPELASRAAILGLSKATRDLQATIDGEDIGISLDPRVTPLRTLSPAGYFILNAPENNVFAGIPGNSYKTVSDGFYLMVAPLPPGAHTITFGGTSTYFASYVTYNLTVEP